jgi:hypothetical protein
MRAQSKTTNPRQSREPGGLGGRGLSLGRFAGSARAWLAIGALLIVGILVIVTMATPTGNVGTGTLIAERTEHNFGQVKIDGGLLATRFPLTVQGPVHVTDLSTT